MVASAAPEWMAGAGTAAAFVLGAVAFTWDRISRHREVRIAQARLVDAWIIRARWEMRQAATKDGIPSYTYPGTAGVTVQLSNMSRQAVRRVDVELESRASGGKSIYECGVIPPTPTVPIEKTLTGVQAPATATPTFMPEVFLPGFFALTIRFTDSAGRRWERTDGGRLRETG